MDHCCIRVLGPCGMEHQFFWAVSGRQEFGGAVFHRHRMCRLQLDLIRTEDEMKFDVDKMRSHMKVRARERYGLKVNGAIRRQLVTKIRNNDFVARAHISAYRYLYILEYNQQELAVIFSAFAQEIITFLPIQSREVQAIRKFTANQKAS